MGGCQEAPRLPHQSRRASHEWGSSPFEFDTILKGSSGQGEYPFLFRLQNRAGRTDHFSQPRASSEFNGCGFDIPFLRRRFESWLPTAHVDLRWTAYKLGYSGGLKEIEPKFGIKRSKRLAEMDGFDAIILWHDYCHGDRYALERLIDYNRADVVGLRKIMTQCYECLVQQHMRFFPKAQRKFAALN